MGTKQTTVMKPNGYDFEQYKNMAMKLRERYSDKVPVIIKKDINSLLTEIDNDRLSTPNECSVYYFKYIIGKKCKLPEKKKLNLYINGKYKITNDRKTMLDIYNEGKDADGLLYLTFSEK